jgi:CTP synthase (UTP-ammonia lyase)
MRSPITIGLIGDRDDGVVAHRAIPLALAAAAADLGIDIGFEWLATDAIVSDRPLAAFAGLWCVPASPYRSMDGALRAIRFAREQDMPFLGTCGGFQHAIVEYARNALDMPNATHAETSPDSPDAVIAPLVCALVEVRDTVHLVPGSRIAAAYRAETASEGYHCSYGLNAAFRRQLAAGPLRVSAHDDAGDVRAVELDGHAFFVATLFQPERAALAQRTPPLVAAFVAACARHR